MCSPQVRDSVPQTVNISLFGVVNIALVIIIFAVFPTFSIISNSSVVCSDSVAGIGSGSKR